jgi:hypothetical protein
MCFYLIYLFPLTFIVEGEIVVEIKNGTTKKIAFGIQPRQLELKVNCQTIQPHLYNSFFIIGRLMMLQ